ncbi:MAG TPA: hypothetical protein VH583_01660 [Vicinamibacterales bacterium]|jgi:hypothetical protein
MSPRIYGGRECWVYRASSPDELCGHHPELVEQALRGDAPDYLLYSPHRESNRGPFGLEGPSGSHAVALTSESLIVSRDQHRRSIKPSVRSIPLASILTMAIGEALTLGWLEVRYAVENTAEAEVVFFHSSGIEQFRNVVRLWLQRQSCRVDAGSDNDSRWTSSPPYVVTQTRPLVRDLRLLEIVNVPEAWADVRGRSRCRAAASVMILMDSAVLLAESERPLEPGMLMFGVNVTCLSTRALSTVGLRLPDDPNENDITLTMTVARHGVCHHVSRDLAMPSAAASHLLVRLASRSRSWEGTA